VTETERVPEGKLRYPPIDHVCISKALADRAAVVEAWEGTLLTAVEDEQIQPAILVMDHDIIGTTRRLALPTQDIILQMVDVLGPVGGLLLGDEEPQRGGVPRLEDAGVDVGPGRDP
jgi:hypothetical protein